MNCRNLRQPIARLIHAKRAFALVIAAAATLCNGPARAELVTFEFTGESKAIEPSLGRTIRGYYTFDSSQQGRREATLGYLDSYDAIREFQFVTDSYGGQIIGKEFYWRFPSRRYSIDVKNRPIAAGEVVYRASIDFLGNNPSIGRNPFADGSPPPQFYLELTALAGSPPLGDKLSVIPPDMGKFKGRMALIYGGKYPDWYDLTSLTLVRRDVRLTGKFRPYASPSVNAAIETRQKLNPVKPATGLITFEFTAVPNGGGDGPAPLGRTLSGYYTFNSATPDRISYQGTSAVYFNAIKSMQFASGSYRGSLSSELHRGQSEWDTGQTNNSISVLEFGPGYQENYRVGMTFVGSPLTAGKGPMSLLMILGNYFGSVRLSRELPLVPPDITHYKNRSLLVNFPSQTPGKFETYYYRVTALTSRPPHVSEYRQSVPYAAQSTQRAEAPQQARDGPLAANGIKDPSRQSLVSGRGQLNSPATSTIIPQQMTKSAGIVAQCGKGLVWRMAGANDYICVTPDSRQRVAQENSMAASRRDPKGAYGPNSCIAGYVWREAFNGDVVCVTPQVRALVRQENQGISGQSR